MEKNTFFAQIGFQPNKAKIYEVLLSLGTAPAGTIAKDAIIVRSTTYKILDELITEGLIEMNEVKGKAKQYTALPPSKLLEVIENKKTAVENFLPELMGVFTSSNFKPKMKFYEGLAGKKKVFEDILTLKNSTVYTFSPMKEVLNLFGKNYMHHYTEKRVKNKIWRHALRPASDISEKKSDWEFYGSNEKVMREIRFLPKGIDDDTLIHIYADKVGVIASEKENYAFIVESKELTKLMKQVFMLLWSTATPVYKP